MFFDGAPLERKMQLKIIGSSVDTYVSSGILVMDLKRIRAKCNLVNEFIKWFARWRDLNQCVDQDAINGIFAGDIEFLDPKFSQYKLAENLSNCIIHSFSSKSWNKNQGFCSDRLYWKTFLKTAWGENKSPDEIIDILCDVCALDRLKQLSEKKSLLYRVVRKLYHLTLKYTGLNILKLYVKNFLYSLKFKLTYRDNNS